MLMSEVVVSHLAFWMQIQSIFSDQLGVQLLLVKVIVYQTNFQHGLSLTGQFRQGYVFLVFFSRRHPEDTKLTANKVAD